jgi:hypothetical protein
MRSLILILILAVLCADVSAQIISNNKLDKYRTTEIKTISPAYDLGKIRMCVDVFPSVKQALPPRVATNSFTYYRINPDGTMGSAYQQQPLTAYTETMWLPGERVKYSVIDLNGRDISVIDTVKKYVKIWERYANIILEYTSKASEAVIRIGFESGPSYSYVGRDALAIPSDKKTMNLGWVGNNAVINRNLVLHEFGHALGFVHEHNSPVNGISWDKEKTYTYFGGAPNYWSRERVDINVFMQYSSSKTNFSSYDPISIMHYQIDSALTTNKISTPFNADLSATDKQYAGIFYPFPAKPPTATGTLRTGDDCDEIDFRIEYNVIDSDKVEFVLQPGKNKHGQTIAFWKQIALPLIGYPARKISIEGGNSSYYIVAPQHIDKSQSIGFWKAKLLGIQTELKYKWDILKAIQGGCRITLTWRNDSCM